MKARHALLSTVVFSLLSSVSHVFAQNAATPAYTITSESLLDNQCVDTPPIGDGFGWDGICTCISDRARIRYEWVKTASIDGQLIATSGNAPGTCATSGSISIFDWRGDQPPVKTQELISSVRDSGDFFGGFGAVAFTTGLIAAESDSNSGSVEGVTVFKRNTEQWEEDVFLQPVGQDRGGFASNMLFLDESRLLIDENDALTIYDTSDWSSRQEIPIQATKTWRIELAGDGFVLHRSEPNGASVSSKTDYFANEGGTYRRLQTFDGAFVSASQNLMVSVQLSPVSLTRTMTITTREFDGSGRWVDIPDATMVFEDSAYIQSVRLVDDQLVLSTDPDGVQIYNLTDTKSWNRVQQISIDSITECDSQCSLQRYETLVDNGRIIVISNTVGTGFFTNIIYGRNDNGEWTKLQTITPVNGHFSLVDDLAIVGSRTSIDQSTVAVFDVPSPSTSQSNQASPTVQEGQGQASQCIDLDGDGFGWDGTSTCTPTNNTMVMSATGCDYTDAALFDGWGWNAAAGESCPPLDSTGNQPANSQPTSSQPVSVQCIDADGDGFGWDGTSTCIPAASSNAADMDCDYTDADRFGGWGWNPTTRQSCPPLTDMIAQPSAAQPQAAQCIDTDGDGFGWNGTATCVP